MFAFLRGIVAHKGRGNIALDVNGAGYALLVPDTVHRRLTMHAEATLLTYCYIREDAFQIYGFLREEELALFRTLLSVDHVGPKVALAVLSALSPSEFTRAVLDSDVAAFNKVPGIGKKTAQRLVLEMKSKMGQDAELSAILGESAGPLEEEARDDAIDALLALGCTPAEAQRAAAKARAQLGSDARDEEVVRMALRSMAKA